MSSFSSNSEDGGSEKPVDLMSTSSEQEESEVAEPLIIQSCSSEESKPSDMPWKTNHDNQVGPAAASGEFYFMCCGPLI